MVDNKIWRFKLREGVKFQDGSDFTSADVLASMKCVSHPSSPLRGNIPLFLNDMTNIFMFDGDWLRDALNPKLR